MTEICWNEQKFVTNFNELPTSQNKWLTDG